MKSLITTLAILLFLPAFVHAQAGIAASPMKIDFKKAPGSTQTFNVTVSNPTKDPLEVSVSLSDWKRDSAGAIVYAPSGSLSTSCSNWLKIFPSTDFTLPAEGSKEITIMMNVPDSSNNKVRTSMLLFTQLNPQKVPGKDGVAVSLAVRIGVQVVYTPPTASKIDVEITNFRDTVLAGDKSIGKTLLLTLQNTGDMVADGKVNLELTDARSGKKTSLPETRFYTLPGAVRVLQIPLSVALPAGKYSATALVDLGQEQELKIGELDFKY